MPILIAKRRFQANLGTGNPFLSYCDIPLQQGNPFISRIVIHSFSSSCSLVLSLSMLWAETQSGYLFHLHNHPYLHTHTLVGVVWDWRGRMQSHITFTGAQCQKSSHLGHYFVKKFGLIAFSLTLYIKMLFPVIRYCNTPSNSCLV